MGEWQPIETAPKDGSPIRVFGPDKAHGTYMGPARWSGYGRWEKLHRHGFINMTTYPTHWMPLSEPTDRVGEPREEPKEGY